MNTDILITIDGSYWIYYVIFGAVNKYMEHVRLEAETLIKDPELTDQENLPDLLVSDAFKKELKKSLISRCEVVDWILKTNFQDQLDIANNIDILFVLDDFVKNSFRKQIYPEYKATRKLIKRSYDINKIRNYVMDVLFPELNITKQFNYKIIRVNGAEGDDIIACVMKNFNDYGTKILFASDKDFQQLENVEQYDLRGNKVVSKITVKKEDIFLSPKEALMVKILMGDGADNIPAIAEKVGPVKAYKLSQDKEKLKNLLIENQSAAKQFSINKQIIDFNQIPHELSDKIITEVCKILSDNTEKSQTEIITLMDL